MSNGVESFSRRLTLLFRCTFYGTSSTTKLVAIVSRMRPSSLRFNRKEANMLQTADLPPEIQYRPRRRTDDSLTGRRIIWFPLNLLHVDVASTAIHRQVQSVGRGSSFSDCVQPRHRRGVTKRVSCILHGDQSPRLTPTRWHRRSS